jgi:hypothetical protein
MFLVAAEQRVGEGVVLNPKRAPKAPKIDAKLNDVAWQSKPLVSGHFIVNHPVYGEQLTQETDVWISYDPDNLYFAFYCHDNEPDKIKASVTRRDNIFNEDWVGVDLDTTGNRQVTYEFYCNPRGMQADLLNSSSGGETAEPDWVWYSAGRVVNDGYIVEMRIPLKSIQFKSGKNITMNMAFYRFVSRTGTNASWPQISEKTGYFNSLAPTVFNRLDKQMRLEALPSVTYGNIWDRQAPDKWSEGDDSTDVGIGIKYGITSTINAEVTINPDFSQVESDQFQVLANQRYPIFYSEKRPFFMEVRNMFNVAATGGDSNMRNAFHTRHIVDPAWGGKLTGETGKLTFGVLAAGDEYPGRELENFENPYLGKNANFMSGRLKYGLKGDNYIGILYSGLELGGDYNRVIGGDFRHRFKGNHNISFNALYSFSKGLGSPEETKGGSFSLKYGHYKKHFATEWFLEHFDPSFRMDSAFFYRNGMTKLTGYIGPNFYPDSKKWPWLKRINPFFFGFYTYDQYTKMDDLFFLLGLRFNFSKQGHLRLDFRHHEESWAGEKFKQDWFRGWGGIQLTKWLNIFASLSFGDSLFYDPVDPFLGNSTSYSFEVSLQPNSKLTQDLSYEYQHFNRMADGERIYDLDILVSRTTFQFNKYLFVRSLIQYDSYSKVILTDLLASFTLIPGTVVHVGYGSLHQKQSWNDRLMTWEQRIGAGRYYQTTQSFFVKISYLYRF